MRGTIFIGVGVIALSACGASKGNETAQAAPAPPEPYPAPQTVGAAETGGPPAYAAAVNAPPAQSTRAASRNLLRFEPSVIVDATGFERPIAAATLFVPAGWTARGGVVWGQQNMCVNGYNFDWSAVSPDGLSAVAVLPQARWEQTSYGAAPSTPGCGTAPYTDVRAYLEAVVRGYKPGAQIIDFRRRPDLETGANNSATPMPLGEIRNWTEAGEVLFAYQENGRDMRGTAASAVQFSLTTTDAGMGPMKALTAFAPPGWAAVAPNGSLNFALVEAVRRSIRPDPQWSQRIANHNYQIGKVAIEESAKRARMISQSNEEISRIRSEAWSAQQESADRRAREFGEVIKGVETYADADAPGGTVELSHNYDNAWRMNDGTYVLTSDPNFDPWRDLGVEGRKLEAVP